MQLISTQLRNWAFLTMFYKIQTSTVLSYYVTISPLLYNQQPSVLSINL